MKVKLKLNIVLDIEPDMLHWKEADDEQREIFVKEQFQMYIEDNMNEILENVQFRKKSKSE